MKFLEKIISVNEIIWTYNGPWFVNLQKNHLIPYNANILFYSNTDIFLPGNNKEKGISNSVLQRFGKLAIKISKLHLKL